MKFKVLILFCLFFVPAQVFAHGSGTTIEQVAGGYELDFDYEAESLSASQSVRFNLNILDQKNGNEVDFTSIWVRVEKNKKVFFASGLARPQFGKAGFLYAFESGGDYEVFLRFEDKEKSLIEFTVPLKVENQEAKKLQDIKYTYPALFLVALIAGFILGKKLK